jgi:hypothetical protein
LANRCREGAYANHHVSYAETIVTTGATAYFVDSRTGLLLAHTFDGAAGDWVAQPGWPKPVAHASSLAIAGDAVVFGSFPSQWPGTYQKAGIFAQPQDGGTPFFAEGQARAWHAVVKGTNEVIVGADDSRLYSSTLDNPALSLKAIGAISRAAPVLGQGGLMYLTTYDGSLQVRRTSDFNLEWQESQFGGSTMGPIEASPNIDCGRNSSGTSQAGRPGVLYAAGGGKLYAFIVDSHGIDVTAAWPKYQHDPRNTGNASTDLELFQCP